MKNLNSLAAQIHLQNKKWWTDEKGLPIQRNKLELLSLAISEVSEALEGERRNLMDDKLPNRKMAEVEMADTYIRLLDFSAGFRIRLNAIKLLDPIPENKGEALFILMRLIINIERSETGAWINLSLTYIEAYCKKHNYDIRGALMEKLRYNRTRKDHSRKSRAEANGKKF